MNGTMSITTKRLRELINDTGKTKQAIAIDMGCDVSTVIKHYNGDRSVNSEFIVRYAEYFHVSTDYLLGCENNPTENEIINLICEYTRLSKGAIKALMVRNYFHPNTIDPDPNDLEKLEHRDIIDSFFEGEWYYDLMVEVVFYYYDLLSGYNKAKELYDQLLLTYKDYKSGKKTVEDLENSLDKFSDYDECLKDSYIRLYKMQEVPKDFVKDIYKELVDNANILSRKSNKLYLEVIEIINKAGESNGDDQTEE